jgi:hypothetical protein
MGKGLVVEPVSLLNGVFILLFIYLTVAVVAPVANQGIMVIALAALYPTEMGEDTEVAGLLAMQTAAATLAETEALAQ